MYITPAKKEHLPAIQALLNEYGGKLKFSPHAINKRDISLIALVDSKVVGFFWAGLMAKNTYAYIGAFIIHPDYTGRGLGRLFRDRVIDSFKRRGVQDFVAVVEQDQYHDKVLVNSLKFAMHAHKSSFTLIYGNTERTDKEAKGL